MSMVTVQPSNVAPRTTQTNSAGNTVVAGSGYLLPYLPNVAAQTSQPQYYMTAFPLQFSLLENATETTSDTYEMQVMGRNLHAIAVTGTFVGTVLVEGTLDGQNWAPLSTISNETIEQYSGVYQSLRVSVTGYTSGTITVTGMTQRS